MFEGNQFFICSCAIWSFGSISLRLTLNSSLFDLSWLFLSWSWWTVFLKSVTDFVCSSNIDCILIYCWARSSLLSSLMSFTVIFLIRYLYYIKKGFLSLFRELELSCDRHASDVSPILPAACSTDFYQSDKDCLLLLSANESGPFQLIFWYAVKSHSHPILKSWLWSWIDYKRWRLRRWMDWTASNTGRWQNSYQWISANRLGQMPVKYFLF